METFFNILISGILLGGIYALVSIGLNLIFGVVRIVNFAQGEFIMLAMYATFFCAAKLGFGPYFAVRPSSSRARGTQLHPRLGCWARMSATTTPSLSSI